MAKTKKRRAAKKTVRRAHAPMRAVRTRKPQRKVRRRRARKNPAGELATILVANGGPMKRRRRKRRRVGVSQASSRRRPAQRRHRRRHARVAAARVVHRLVRRRARRNPDSGIVGMVSDAAATTAGVLAARFAQNTAAMKLEKGAASRADAKARAGKPLYIALGAAVPVAIGLLVKKLAKQDRIGNGFIVGGLTFAVHELARQYVFSKAPESSPLYALGEDLGDAELGSVAQGEDGTEWAYVPNRGWHRIDTAPLELAAPRVQRRVTRTLDGLAVRDTLGADESLSGVELRDALGGVELRDALGEEGPYVGADWDSIGGVELRDALGAADDGYPGLGAPYGYGDEG